MSTKKSDEELQALATVINTEHAAIIERERGMASRAIAAGEKLRELKKAVGHGAWEETLPVRCPTLSPETARVYMKLAKNKGTILKQQRAADLSIREALAILRPPKVKKKKKKKSAKGQGSPDLASTLDPGAVEVDDVLKVFKENKWEPADFREIARGLVPEEEGLKGQSLAQVLASLKAAWTRDKLGELAGLLRRELAEAPPPPKAGVTLGKPPEGVHAGGPMP